MDQIEVLKEKIDTLPDAERTAFKARAREAFAEVDAAAAERARQAKRDLLAVRQSSAEALIASVEALRPQLIEFDKRNETLRRALRVNDSRPLELALSREIANLNLHGARDQIAATAAHVLALIDSAK